MKFHFTSRSLLIIISIFIVGLIVSQLRAYDKQKDDQNSLYVIQEEQEEDGENPTVNSNDSDDQEEILPLEVVPTNQDKTTKNYNVTDKKQVADTDSVDQKEVSPPAAESITETDVANSGPLNGDSTSTESNINDGEPETKYNCPKANFQYLTAPIPVRKGDLIGYAGGPTTGTVPKLEFYVYKLPAYNEGDKLDANQYISLNLPMREGTYEKKSVVRNTYEPGEGRVIKEDTLGIWFIVSSGAPVYAIDDGEVILKDDGGMMLIEHDDCIVSSYRHMLSFAL